MSDSEDPYSLTLPSDVKQAVVHSNHQQKIHRVLFDRQGIKKEFFVTETGARSGILVVCNDSILMVRQYRLILDAESLEIPGGKVDAKETPKDAALRECYEETGVKCLNAKMLLPYHVGLDTTYNPTFIFYATEFNQPVKQLKANPAEVVETYWVPINDSLKSIASGDIMDVMTITAILGFNSLIKSTCI